MISADELEILVDVQDRELNSFAVAPISTSGTLGAVLPAVGEQ